MMEALKKKASEPKPEAAGVSLNHDQHAKLENLRSQICEFSKKEATAFETDRISREPFKQSRSRDCRG